ncbi:MAG: helix-turn-helix domain-containing protein [Oscillospiraceae bacterium]
MKLNADIIYDYLSAHVRLTRIGISPSELSLQRPRLYMGGNAEFEENQLYIALADQLPTHPAFRNGALVICVEGVPPTSYTTGSGCCLVISGSVDIFSVMNWVQEIFDRFDAWEINLQKILNTSASMQELLDVSQPIFENPIVLIGADFHYIAYSNIINEKPELAMFRPDKDGKFNTDIISYTIKSGDTNMGMRNPFKILVDGHTHFSVNLFECNKYVGNLKIAFVLRPFRTSDNVLSQYLAKTLEIAFPHLKELRADWKGSGALREAVGDLLRGVPLTNSKRQYMEAGFYNTQFLLCRCVLGERSKSRVPTAYFCDHIESTIAGSIAAEYDNSIVVFFCVSASSMTSEEIRQKLCKLLESMNLKAGVSNTFNLLGQTRQHYRQACIALELGSTMKPNDFAYNFCDYVQYYMIYSCTGEFPLELVYKEGFRRLAEMSRDGQIDYLDTLEQYLDNNMNIAKTSGLLYIHRSTFLERIKRIESVLQMDLHDPEARTYLNVVLKYRSLMIKMRGRQTPQPYKLPEETETQTTVSELPHIEYEELESLL